MDKNELCEKLRINGFSEKIVNSFYKVKREDFMPPGSKDYAYEDRAMSIGYSQTISQPTTIAFMLSLLDVKPGQKILEVGSGSGYVLTLLNELEKDLKIYGAERIKELADMSTMRLSNIKNIQITHTATSLGLPDSGPFDRILVSAAADQLPDKLINQLNDDGILVCPVQNSIVKAIKQGNNIEMKDYFGFVFVPLIDN